jgi:hypothetical protein
MIHEKEDVIVVFLKTGSWTACHIVFMLELEVMVTGAESSEMV